eukprot:gnl/TRDRNA2_/TRDRNA2_135145_c0_seq1.p1 gnl/TRDRNA2_/TRDRNA2_135145_c0~~gnl/TRDRNA2_/TRDRNA2_135145_c0_seq1.p1  ORF type:complete len:451 (-),score=87.10 gnl/TRDRNA2_/TRDRNA2_135145_c0_seq1:54-1283(-)
MENAGPRSRSLKGGAGSEQSSFWHEKMRENKSSQDLFQAAVNGDVKAAMMALVAHGNPNCCNAEGLTSLALAAAGGHLEVARLLVTSGAKVNATPCRHGLTPMGLASAQGHVDIVRLLLQWKADANVGRVSGNAPLTRASAAGRLEVCAMLLEHKADPDSYDDKGVTAMMQSVDHERLEVTKLLLDRGASASQVDRQGCTALSRVVDLLLRLEPNGKQLGSLRNPMSEYEYWVEMCSILVERDADVNSIDSQGDSLLCRTIRRRRKDVLITLLDLGANRDLGVPALNSGTALQLAAELGLRELCQVLVLKAASVNKPSSAGATPLGAAIENGDEELCFYLISASADCNRRDARSGMTLLMLAASRGLRRVYDRMLPHVGIEAVSQNKTVEHQQEGERDAEYEYISDEED